MHGHFKSFTPEAMRAFRQQLEAGSQRRSEFLNNSCQQTSSLLAGSRKHHNEGEAQRRLHAADHAAQRRQFLARLRARVHALLERFEHSRREMFDDLQQMNREVRAASESFRAVPRNLAARRAP